MPVSCSVSQYENGNRLAESCPRVYTSNTAACLTHALRLSPPSSKMDSAPRSDAWGLFLRPCSQQGPKPGRIEKSSSTGQGIALHRPDRWRFATTDATVNHRHDSLCAEPLLPSLTLDLHEAGTRREAFDTASKGSAPFAPTRSTTTR